MDDVRSADLGRELARRRKRVDKQCLACGVSFQGLSWSRYCTPKCKHDHWMAQHREQWNEKRRARRAQPAEQGES